MIAEKIVMPKRILDMGWDFARSRALATGVDLDIFTHIANGKHTVDLIAQAASSSLRGMEMLLNALAGLQLLTKDKEGYIVHFRCCGWLMCLGHRICSAISRC